VEAINFQLMLAVETNTELRESVMNKFNNGLMYTIPYVQAFKTSNLGTTQNISIQLDQGNGHSLMKVIHSIYNAQENLDTMYDHANTAIISDVYDNANQKVRSYYTQLNGKRTQDINLDCTASGPFLDFMQHRRQLRGSILGHLRVYQYNWFHCDDFCNFDSNYDQSGDSELISGIPMSVAPLTWSFVGLNMKATPFNSFQHYTWFVFSKKLIVSPGQVIVN